MYLLCTTMSADIQGINGARSWVALKGDNWLAYNNTGFGSLVNGAGYRIVNLVYKEGSNNQLTANTCVQLARGALCIYIQPKVINASISCNNVDVNSSGAGLCNCNPHCAANVSSLKSMAVSSWAVDSSNVLDEDEAARPFWD